MKSLPKRLAEWTAEEDAIHAIFAVLGVCDNKRNEVHKICPSFFDEDNWAANAGYHFLKAIEKIGAVEKDGEGRWRWNPSYYVEDFAHGVESVDDE